MRSDIGRYVRIRFVAHGCDMITIAQFLMLRSDTFRQDCPNRVHDEVQT